MVSVTDCDAVAVPTTDEPNARLVAESVATGPRPVPLSAILCGEFPALSTMVTAAVSETMAAVIMCMVSQSQ